MGLLQAWLSSHPSAELGLFLVEGFTHGFHTGFVTLPLQTFECPNLRSCGGDMGAVDTLLQSELDKGFVIGPFTVSPFQSWRVNPLGLVKGKFSNKLRLIYDLSAPHCSAVPSLNSLIPSEEFSLKYASIDQAIQQVIEVGQGAWLSKADIADAFKLLPIAPSLWQWHGIKWRELYYFATRLTFGSKSSPWLFDVFAQALEWILVHEERCHAVIHYLGDFLLIESPQRAPVDLRKLLAVFSALDVPLATKKLEGPAWTLTFLGVILDTKAMQARLPADKLARIRECIHIFSVSRVCTRVELLSLLGMLNFAMRIIPQGRSFISRLLALLPSAPDSDSRVVLDAAALADLRMWDEFLQCWNGIAMFVPGESCSSPQVGTDAAATVGYAAIFGTHWLAGPWPEEVLAIPGFTESSALFEIYPIVAAAWVWGGSWAGQTVVFSTDNQAAVEIITKGRSRSLVIMSLVRRLIWLSLHHKFHFLCKFISGVENGAADALSRLNFPSFFLQVPHADAQATPSPQASLLMLD